MRRDYRRGKMPQRTVHRDSLQMNRGAMGHNYYNSTSVAYDYYRENVYYEPRRKQHIAKKKEMKKNRIKTVDEKTVHSWEVYFAVFVVFVFSLLTIGSKAFVAEQKEQITQLRAQLKQVQEDNTNIQTELTKNLNLEEVEKQAEQRLGMQKPEAYQIVYIDVPAQSYTVKHESSENESDKLDLVKSIKNIVRID